LLGISVMYLMYTPSFLARAPCLRPFGKAPCVWGWGRAVLQCAVQGTQCTGVHLRPFVLGRSQNAVGCVALCSEFRSCTLGTLPHSSLVRLAQSALGPPCGFVVEGKKQFSTTKNTTMRKKTKTVKNPSCPCKQASRIKMGCYNYWKRFFLSCNRLKAFDCALHGFLRFQTPRPAPKKTGNRA
jgi:hypothetical protein